MSLIIACARPGSPTGGPKDDKPPEVVTSEPPNLSTRFTGKTIKITFNEYFDLKNIRQKLVVSPPMEKKPEFKIRGKTLEIKLFDSLQPDRTYAINFGDALVDLNESNPLNNFQFVFSTGDKIDSLQASGQVIQAFDGKPAEEVMVMLYSKKEDSTPLRELPVYISKTDKEGKFRLRNLAEDSYKIFALKDGNNNFLFDQPNEAIAFLDSLVRPGLEPTSPVDTLAGPEPEMIAAKDTVRDTTGTAKPRPAYRFTPDNLVLRLFTEVRPNPYLSGAERPRRDQIRLKFSEKIDSMNLVFNNLPENVFPFALDWYADADTIDLWITDSLAARKDTIRGFVYYPAYDSLERPYMKSDTIKLIYKPPPKQAGAPKKEFVLSATPEKTRMLEQNQPFRFNTTLPFASIDTAKIFITIGKDSTASPIEYRFEQDTISGLFVNHRPWAGSNPRQIRFLAPWIADTTYNIKLLQGAFTGYQGQSSDSMSFSFKLKGADKYGSLKIELPDLKETGIVELIGPGNKPVAQRTVGPGGTAVFAMMPPAKYTARLIFDSNGNGRWDPGRYTKHTQPEKVLVFGKELNLKANWEIMETWKWEGD